MVVGKYTQTRQRWLKGKIVKSSHSRHYKKTFTVPRKKGRKTGGEHKKKKKKKKNRKKVKSKENEKDKKENEKTKKVNTVGMHQ